MALTPRGGCEKLRGARRSLDELSTDHWQFKSQILSADQANLLSCHGPYVTYVGHETT